MAATDAMPRLVDDDEEGDDDILVEDFSWLLQTEPENNTHLERDKTRIPETFGDLPLTYDEILFTEPNPLALCTVTMLKAKENGAATIVATKNCKNDIDLDVEDVPALDLAQQQSGVAFDKIAMFAGRRQLPA